MVHPDFFLLGGGNILVFCNGRLAVVNFYNNLIKGQVKSPILYTMRDKLFMFLTFRTVKKIMGERTKAGVGESQGFTPLYETLSTEIQFW